MAVLSTGLFASFLGIWLFFAGVREAGPSNASIIMNVEPVLTVILSVVVLGETLEWMQGLGGLLIIAGLIFLQQAEAKK
jgi:drug/metabolite transporter (DMT)-like permease